MSQKSKGRGLIEKNFVNREKMSENQNFNKNCIILKYLLMSLKVEKNYLFVEAFRL